MARNIIIRVIGLALVLVCLDLIYEFTLYRKDLYRECSHIVDMKDQQPLSDMFYFGESSNFTKRDDDSTKLAIADLANLFYPGLKITGVNHSATHAGMYRYWINQIDLEHQKPKALIITLNLRSFDAAWIHSRLETPLQVSIALLKPYPPLVNRFLLSLNAFDNKTEQQREQLMLEEWETKKLEFPFDFKYKTVRDWDNAMANGGYKNPDGSWNMEKIQLACHYIKAYAFNIRDDNPRVKDFDFIADWCYKNKINLYLNLMAENIQYADSLVGKELVFLMKNNRDYLVKRYNKNNCVVVDNLELVEGKEFIDQKWTTEHYGYKGRMAIAGNLADKLKNQFKDNYIKAY
jgi:hypothetical protein